MRRIIEVSSLKNTIAAGLFLAAGLAAIGLARSENRFATNLKITYEDGTVWNLHIPFLTKEAVAALAGTTHQSDLVAVAHAGEGQGAGDGAGTATRPSVPERTVVARPVEPVRPAKVEYALETLPQARIPVSLVSSKMVDREEPDPAAWVRHPWPSKPPARGRFILWVKSDGKLYSLPMLARRAGAGVTPVLHARPQVDLQMDDLKFEP